MAGAHRALSEAPKAKQGSSCSCLLIWTIMLFKGQGLIRARSSSLGSALEDAITGQGIQRVAGNCSQWREGDRERRVRQREFSYAAQA